MEKSYSVLMSVYYKEKPENLKLSMESILGQTECTDDFVLICDGPLCDGLDTVIEDMQQRFGDILHVVRLKENTGLGNALNIGMPLCKNELIARMDSDDISYPDRCEKQLAVFKEHPDISVCSGTVLEFDNDIANITGRRVPPQTNEDIKAFSRKRNPFNHPAVMFKRSAVESVGGYDETFPLFEDYYLWIRMLMEGMTGYNIQEPLLYMRTPEDFFIRRGGKQYLSNMLRFHRWVRSTGWASLSDFITGAIPHAAVCMLPNSIRVFIYKKLHR